MTTHWRNVNRITTSSTNTYLLIAFEATIASCVLFLNAIHTSICSFFTSKSTHRCIDLAIEMSKTSKTQISLRQHRVVDASEKNDVRHNVDEEKRDEARARKTTTSKLLCSLVCIASQRHFAYLSEISILIWEKVNLKRRIITTRIWKDTQRIWNDVSMTRFLHAMTALVSHSQIEKAWMLSLNHVMMIWREKSEKSVCDLDITSRLRALTRSRSQCKLKIFTTVNNHYKKRISWLKQKVDKISMRR